MYDACLLRVAAGDAAVVRLFLPSAEDLLAEEQDLQGCQKEHENDQRQIRSLGGKRGQEHHGEAQDDGREILVDHVFGGGGLKLAVDLAEQDGARAGRSGQHTVHHQKFQ